MDARYQLVVFDCDGTLVDTVVDVVACFNEALQAHGFDACPLEVVASFIGKPLETIVRGLINYGAGERGGATSEEVVAAVSDAYRSVYASHPKPNTLPFAGMTELVDDLLTAGVAVAVNSNKPEPALLGLMDRCFPGRDMLVTGYAPERPTKPDPAGALQSAKRTGVAVADAVYVGDTLTDLETALNARMDCIIMTWGQGTRDLYGRPELKACCDTADQLRAVLFE